MQVVHRIGSANPGRERTGRRQHYVPRLYLRNFARKSKGGKFRLHEYNLSTFRLRLTTVEDTGLESRYYDNIGPGGEMVSIDHWLQRLEKEATPVLVVCHMSFAGLALAKQRAVSLASTRQISPDAPLAAR